MKTVDSWIDFSMRSLRQKFRDVFNAWVGGDKPDMIKEAEQLEVNLKSFIEYLKGKKDHDPE